MDDLLTYQKIRNTILSLGSHDGNSYVINPNVLILLNEINSELSNENQIFRTYRRAFGFGDNVGIEIINLLQNADDNDVCDVAIIILANLTLPLENLFSAEALYSGKISQEIIMEISKTLYGLKKTFLDPKSIVVLVEYLKKCLDFDIDTMPNKREQIKTCLMLLRNILRIPEYIINQSEAMSQDSLSTVSMQNIILWNLFIQSIDKIFLNLMTCSHSSHWAGIMVQIFGLMYKDQNVDTLANLLNVSIDGCVPDNSGDDESNTSDHSRNNSSPGSTSDNASDFSSSSNTDEEKHKKRLKKDRKMEVKYKNIKLKAIKNDHNYSKPKKLNKTHKSKSTKKLDKTLTGDDDIEMTLSKPVPVLCDSLNRTSDHSKCENCQTLISSKKDSCSSKVPEQQARCSSNAETNNLEKKELKRKKLLQRSESSLISMKGLVSCKPTDEVISNLLKEFMVDFLLKGFNCLFKDLLTNSEYYPNDVIHTFWLIGYFLKFAAQLEVDLEHINCVLSYDTFSFLTYQGEILCQRLEINPHQDEVNYPTYISLALLVTAIMEFLKAIESYKNATHLSDNLDHLQHQLITSRDISYLFAVLLHRFNPRVQTIEYFMNLIMCNHIFLKIVDNAKNFLISSMDVGHVFQFWKQEDLIRLRWYYIKSNKSYDPIGEIFETFKNIANTKKSRIAIIQQLLQQNIISYLEYNKLMQSEKNLLGFNSNLESLVGIKYAYDVELHPMVVYSEKPIYNNCLMEG